MRLTAYYYALIEQLILTGRYDTMEEVVKEGLRLVAERDLGRGVVERSFGEFENGAWLDTLNDPTKPSQPNVSIPSLSLNIPGPPATEAASQRFSWRRFFKS